MNRRTFMYSCCTIILVVVLLSACSKGSEPASSAAGTNYPAQTIDVLVPFAAGGSTDTSARALVSELPKHLPENVNINVVNAEGGGGVMGMNQLYHSDPNGYTIGMTTIGPTTLKTNTENTAFRATDFKPIAQVNITPNILIVHKDAPWDTYEEWERYVEENPAEFTFGTSGAGLIQHVSMEHYQSVTGIELTHVPFDGGAPAISAMLGGHIDGALVQSTEAFPQVESGEAKALFNTGSMKSEGFEDTPLLTEKGVEVSSDVWAGLLAPPDTPDEIITILESAVDKALQEEQVIDQFNRIGIDPSYLDSQTFGEKIAEDNELNYEILKNTGLVE